MTLHKSGPKLAIPIIQNLCPEFVVAFHKSYGSLNLDFEQDIMRYPHHEQMIEVDT